MFSASRIRIRIRWSEVPYGSEDLDPHPDPFQNVTDHNTGLDVLYEEQLNGGKIANTWVDSCLDSDSKSYRT
jgi:hypothetical protein